MRGVYLAALAGLPFVLAVKDELERWMATPDARPAIETARLAPAAAGGDHYVLELRAVPMTEWGAARAAVTCRSGGEASAAIGLWARRSESVDVAPEDDRALAVYPLDHRPDACQIELFGGDAPSYCVDADGALHDGACDPPVIATPSARPDPI